ncbi:MAG: DciA family protein [Phycisphaeraceae bacterium]
MPPRDPSDAYLDRLRQWRTRPDRDYSLGFYKQVFKREIEKPAKQLAAITALWEELIPADLASHTRLDSLLRGVLKVSVDSSSVLFELDRRLRSGLEKELIVQHKGPALRRVQLRVASIEDQPDPRRQPRGGQP